MSNPIELGKAALASIKDFRKQRDLAEQALQQILDAIHALEDERRDLETMPAARDDVIAAMRAHVGAAAAAGRQRLREMVSGHQERRFDPSSPGNKLTLTDFAWRSVRSATAKGSMGDKGDALISFSDPNRRGASPVFDLTAMCALFEEQIAGALRRAVVESWPTEYADAVPGAQRQVRIAQINAEIEGLASRRDELTSLLATAIAG
jgi:hypothetical protein